MNWDVSQQPLFSLSTPNDVHNNVDNSNKESSHPCESSGLVTDVFPVIEGLSNPDHSGVSNPTYVNTGRVALPSPHFSTSVERNGVTNEPNLSRVKLYPTPVSTPVGESSESTEKYQRALRILLCIDRQQPSGTRRRKKIFEHIRSGLQAKGLTFLDDCEMH